MDVPLPKDSDSGNMESGADISAHSEAAPSAVCAASVEGGLLSGSAIQSIAQDAPKVVWNLMTYALEELANDIAGHVETVTVRCNAGLKDFYALPANSEKKFAERLHKHFTGYSCLIGFILDLTVNHKLWHTTQYLYACIVARETVSEGQAWKSFAVTMEMLLFMCISNACANANLLTACRQVFGAEIQNLRLAWKLHKYEIAMDGSVQKKWRVPGEELITIL